MMLNSGCMGTNLGTLTTFGYTVPVFSVPKAKNCTQNSVPKTIHFVKKSVMKATAFLRKVKLKDGTQKGVIYFRVRSGKKDFRLASSLTIDPDYWDSELPGYSQDTPTCAVSPMEMSLFNEAIRNILMTIQIEYGENADQAWLSEILTRHSNKVAKSDDAANCMSSTPTEPSSDDEQRERNEPTMLDYYALYLEKAEFHAWHRQAQTAVMNKLTRYEKWLGFVNGQPDFRLYLSDIDKEQIEDYKDYIDHEYQYYKTNPTFFKQFKLAKSCDIRPNSKNAVICHIKRLNMFLNWCVKMGYLTDLSFRNITCDQQLYGTPFYLTMEERDKIYDYDFSEYPRLEIHRDKFIFQCLVGCRSNDLVSFTWDNITGDFLEYIPHKNLLAGRTTVVRVPLCDNAKAILLRIDPDEKYLFNKFCIDLYRTDIKQILKMVGIDRTVLYYNQQRRKAEPRPLYEVAASHLARRTFIGNLYKQVQDQALIASLTGHTETSTSFQRYRDIDDDIKRNVLSLID